MTGDTAISSAPFPIGKHIVWFGHVQPIRLSNEVQLRAGKNESEPLMYRITAGISFLTCMFAARRWHERKKGNIVSI